MQMFKYLEHMEKHYWMIYISIAKDSETENVQQ